MRFEVFQKSLVLDSLADLNNTRHTIDDDRLLKITISECHLEHSNRSKSRSRRNSYIRIWLDSDNGISYISKIPVESSWNKSTRGDRYIPNLVERIIVEKWGHEPSLCTRTRTVVCIGRHNSSTGNCDISLCRHNQCSRSR